MTTSTTTNRYTEYHTAIEFYSLGECIELSKKIGLVSHDWAITPTLRYRDEQKIFFKKRNEPRYIIGEYIQEQFIRRKLAEYFTELSGMYSPAPFIEVASGGFLGYVDSEGKKENRESTVSIIVNNVKIPLFNGKKHGTCIYMGSDNHEKTTLVWENNVLVEKKTEVIPYQNVTSDDDGGYLLHHSFGYNQGISRFHTTRHTVHHSDSITPRNCPTSIGKRPTGYEIFHGVQEVAIFPMMQKMEIMLIYMIHDAECLEEQYMNYCNDEKRKIKTEISGIIVSDMYDYKDIIAIVVDYAYNMLRACL